MWKQIVLWGIVVAFGLMWMTRRSGRRSKKAGN
jgi:hypothetical protein